MSNWDASIERMIAAKRLAEENDQEGLARFAPPRTPADPSALRAAIDRAGGALDDQYAEFLRHADGWPRLLHSYDLFGTTELFEQEFDAAVDLLIELEDDVLEDAGVATSDELFPIGASAVAVDVFATVTSAPSPRPVIWFAGDVVERFESFEAFFQYMIDSNRELAAQE